MGGKDESHLVPYVNTWLWPSATLLGTSGLFFSIYIGKVTNAGEWKEIMLDYCHHKRTVYPTLHGQDWPRCARHPEDRSQVRGICAYSLPFFLHRLMLPDAVHIQQVS